MWNSLSVLHGNWIWIWYFLLGGIYCWKSRIFNSFTRKCKKSLLLDLFMTESCWPPSPPPIPEECSERAGGRRRRQVGHHTVGEGRRGGRRACLGLRHRVVEAVCGIRQPGWQRANLSTALTSQGAGHQPARWCGQLQFLSSSTHTLIPLNATRSYVNWQLWQWEG